MSIILGQVATQQWDSATELLLPSATPEQCTFFELVPFLSFEERMQGFFNIYLEQLLSTEEVDLALGMEHVHQFLLNNTSEWSDEQTVLLHNLAQENVPEEFMKKFLSQANQKWPWRNTLQEIQGE